MSSKPPISLWPDPAALGTLTDLYQITMMAGYHAAGMAGKVASFEISVRRMPPDRAYLVFAGLEQAIGDLLALAFDAEQFAEIRRWPAFRGVAPRSWTRLRARDFRAMFTPCPRERLSFRVSRSCVWSPRYRRLSGSKPTCWLPSAIQPSWHRRRPGWSERPQVDRYSNSAPGAGTGRLPGCWRHVRP